MITHHIAKLLEDNGFGTLVLTGDEAGDALIFCEKLPRGKTGIYLVTNGDPLNRTRRTSQSFNLYARGKNDMDGGDRLEEILEFFANECYPKCVLPMISGYSEKIYTNTIILPTSNIQNIGEDSTDRVIYTASAQITYKKEN